jgi:hypothetical protein
VVLWALGVAVAGAAAVAGAELAAVATAREDCCDDAVAWAARVVNPATSANDPPTASRLIRDIRRSAASRAAAARVPEIPCCWCEVTAAGCARSLIRG